MIYRKATKTDLAAISSFVKAAIETMEAQGIFQWDDVYPTEADFAADLQSEHLFVGEKSDSRKSEIAVVYAVNCNFDDAYNAVAWKSEGNFRIIHRLCVNPQFQGLGIAKETLRHIEEDLKAQGVKGIRLDVFSENPQALNLYLHSGYEQTGIAEWRKGTFFLMEKVLQK